jgi:hypothetical protein
MKSSCHSVIPFLPFILSHFGLQSPELDPIPLQQLTQMNSSSTEFSQLLTTNELLCPVIAHLHGPRRKHSLSFVEKVCLLIRCLVIDVLLLRSLAPAGMGLRSRCLAMGLYVTLLTKNLTENEVISH